MENNMDLPIIKVRVTVNGLSTDVSVVARDASAALSEASKRAKKAFPHWTSIECEVID